MSQLKGQSGLTHKFELTPPEHENALKMCSNLSYYAHRVCTFFTVRFIKFPVLDFGLDHYGSQPFNWPSSNFRTSLLL